MKRFLLASGIIAFLLCASSIAFAQPIPPRCMPHGHLDCGIPGCQQFCKPGPHHPAPPPPPPHGPHAHPVPPPPGPHHAPPPPPPHGPHAHPVPPPPPHHGPHHAHPGPDHRRNIAVYEDNIQRLREDNARLDRRKKELIRMKEDCRRFNPPHVCHREDNEIRDIDMKISNNMRRIDEYRDLIARERRY